MRDELLSTHQCYEKRVAMALSFSVASFCVKKLLLKSLVKAILFIGRINILLHGISIDKPNIEIFSDCM